MKTKKHMGIWMDHSVAHLIDAGNSTLTNTIASEFTREERQRTLSKGEYMMHNTEQQEQHAYYRKIGDAIRNYDKVLLFGPTKAKEELLNMLKADRNFEKIEIDLKHADKMTENQQHAFVKDYFTNE
jgi:hypothetical protein